MRPPPRRSPGRYLQSNRPVHRALLLCATSLVVASCSAEAGPTGPAGPEGPQGPQGPAGPGTAPSISAVSPLFLYREHEDTIVITGSGTSWTSAAQIDFGAGVTVTQATVASPTAIVALVVADSTAPLGVRDVSVTEGSDDVTFVDVFEVRAPLFVVLSRGAFVRGGVLEGVLVQRNDERLFHAPDDPAEEVTWYRAERPEIRVPTLPTSPRRVPFLSSLALNEAGPVHYVVEAGFFESRTPALDPLQPTTVATPLGIVTDFQAGPLETVIHRVDPLAGQVVSLTFSDPVPLGPPGFGPLLIPPDSAFETLAGRSRFYAPTSAPWFVSVNVATSVDYTIGVDTASVQPVALDGGPTTGTLGGPFGADYYSVDTGAGATVTINLDDGPTDTCGPAGDIDAWLIVHDPIGRVEAEAASGCGSVQWGPTTAAGTYTVEVRPTPTCAACPFDYTITAVEN